MKIRTDFVTNSSSVSTVEIVIDNPMLLEILQRYKDMGAFGEHTKFRIGEFISDTKVSVINKPAFHFCEDLYGEGWATVTSSPKTLDEVLGEIIAIISDSTEINIELLAQMKEELRQKEEEIEKNYAIVYWANLQEGDEPQVVGGKFTFDTNNGEIYHSYSSAEVIIDNPVLLEILQKYMDLGTFFPDPDYSIGNYENYELNSRSSFEEIIKTPALSVGLSEYSGSWGIAPAPTSLKDVIKSILKSLELGEEVNKKGLYKQLKAELKERHDEINAAYKYVTWKSQDLLSQDFYKDGYHGYINYSDEHSFDPIKGEEYHRIRKAGPGWDKSVDEGIIFGEQHIVNGKVLIDFGYENKGGYEGEEYDE